jgi:transcriptional regulator with XRE-family HTH domain
MDIRRALARSLRLTRKARGYAQEDLATVSGRTYIGEIERGQKRPTLEKLDQLARAMDVHPLTVLTLIYLPNLREQELKTLQDRIATEARDILAERDGHLPRKARLRQG